MAILVQDNFNRANSSSVLGAPQIGPTPVILDGIWGINGNQAYAPSFGGNGCIAVWECSTVNVDITVKRPAGPLSGGGLVIGAVSSQNLWMAFFNNSTTSSPVESSLGKYNGTNTFQPVYKAKGGPAVTATAVHRLIHYNGWVEMWLDSILVLRCFLPEVVTGTRHGLRGSTDVSHRWEDLTISDAPDITMATRTGEVREPAFGTQTTVPKASFVYRGRDTKTQDTTGVS